MGATERKLWYLKRLNLFAGLAKEEIEALAGRLHDCVVQPAAGAALCYCSGWRQPAMSGV